MALILPSRRQGQHSHQFCCRCTPTHVGGGNAQIGGNTGTVAWISALPDWWAWDSYNHLSTWIALEPELTPAIRYEFDVVNAHGRHHVTGDNVAYPGGFINTDYLFDRVGIPGWWGNGDNSQFDGRYDNLYAAVGPNARARLMLSDAADLDASERRLHLLPSGWQDARVDVDRHSLPVAGTLFLHLIDAQGRPATWSTAICLDCALFASGFEP